LHGLVFMLQIIYTTVFRVQRLNSKKRGINITYIIYDVRGPGGSMS